MIERRAVLLLGVNLLSGCMMASEHSARIPKIGDRFRIDTGDGNQLYFSAPLNMTMIYESWFPPKIANHGDAILLKVEGGTHDGEYIAVTAKGGDLRKRIQAYGYCNAAVWRITNPTPSYDYLKDVENIGAAVIWRLVEGT